MFDATAKALADHVLALLPASRPCRRSDLGTLPEPVAHYLGSVLDRKADQKAAAPESNWIDDENELVAPARKVWRTAARAAAQFPERAWQNAVGTASRQVMSYLVDPVDTLVTFAYADGESALKPEQLLERMGAFVPYPYFRDVAEGYLERKGLKGIDRAEFEKLLRRIDKRMVDRFEAGDWIALLKPLFDLTEAMPGHGRAIEGRAVRRFFEAKGFGGLVDALDDNEMCNEDQLLRLIIRERRISSERDPLVEEDEVSEMAPESQGHGAPDDAEPIWQRFARAKLESAYGVDSGREPAAQEVSAEADLDADVSDVAPVSRADETTVGATPVQPARGRPASERPYTRQSKEAGIRIEDVVDAKVIAEASHTDKTAERSFSSTPEAERDASDTDEGGEPLWKQLAKSKQSGKKSEAKGSSNAERESDPPRIGKRPEPLLQLEQRVLGATATERRDWYVQHLARGQESTYRSILEALATSTSWDEAWPILKNAYQENRVEIYHEAIVAFTDAVEARYRR